MARPHTGSVNISNAQVYGDSPEDWRKNRLMEYVRQIAGALQDRLASDPRPVVLVADAEIGRHFQKLGTAAAMLAGVVETNPEAMDIRALHEAAYAVRAAVTPRPVWPSAGSGSAYFPNLLRQPPSAQLRTEGAPCSSLQ